MRHLWHDGSRTLTGNTSAVKFTFNMKSHMIRVTLFISVNASVKREHKKIIEGCIEISEKENIKLRQRYTRIVKQLMIDQRFREHPKRKKKANAAARKLKTIAGRLVREVERKLDDIDRLSIYDERLWLYLLVLGQRRNDSNKIYSFHAPEVKYISKGKEHKKYEFGNKSSFVLTKKSGIVIEAMAFKENIYDGHGIEPQLAQGEDLLGKSPGTLLVDRG